MRKALYAMIVPIDLINDYKVQTTYSECYLVPRPLMPLQYFFKLNS